MEHSLFYIAGGALIVIALVASLLGMRSEKFPSSGMLKGGLLVVALLVAATAYGAVQLAQQEQADRREEANLKADQEAQQQNLENQQAGNAPQPTPADKGAGGSGAAGKIDGATVFVDTGCGSCHALAALGADAQGTIGPDLDEGLADMNKAAIEKAIVDPSAEVPPGYPDGTMPANYKDQLSPDELTALVNYLWETAGLKN